MSIPFVETLRFAEMKEGGEALLGAFPRWCVGGDFAGRGVEIDGSNFERVSVRRLE